MLDNYNDAINTRLDEILKPYNAEYSKLLDAVYYSACAGGKRIRPKIMLEFMRVCGGNTNYALNFACALEMIHTYSLVHDDLPCMDNDDIRRGRPSCHKAFDEATALLAGDALLTDAFSVALKTENISYENVLKSALVLAECAGSKGMIGGQVIDLKYENKTAPISVVKELYRLKTGALLVAAAKIGCILAGADDNKIKAAADFAENIGLAFQIRDDILDIVGNEVELGKPIGSDADEKKSTYVTLVGLEKAQDDVVDITNKALMSLDAFDGDTSSLKQLALELIKRNK